MSKREEIRQRVADVAQRLRERGVASAADTYRCTPAEVAALERDVGLSLPMAYEEFLAQMGRGAGRFWVGTDVAVPGLAQGAKTLLLQDPSGIRLPDDAVVFAMHQGYQFLFVCTGEGDDPPVYSLHGVQRTSARISLIDSRSSCWTPPTTTGDSSLSAQGMGDSP